MSRKLNVILTCMGGWGALNLLEDFESSKLSKEINFIGTHFAIRTLDQPLCIRTEAQMNSAKEV